MIHGDLVTSKVGSYSWTKTFWWNCTVRADFPTPPVPRTTNLNSWASVINSKMVLLRFLLYKLFGALRIRIVKKWAKWKRTLWKCQKNDIMDLRTVPNFRTVKDYMSDQMKWSECSIRIYFRSYNDKQCLYKLQNIQTMQITYRHNL